MKAIVLIILVSCVCCLSFTHVDSDRICASMKKDIKNISLRQHSGENVDDDFNADSLSQIERDNSITTFETCNNFCYALWQENKTPNGTEIKVLLQGCWKQSGEQKCENTNCIALPRSTKALNNTKFCCCRGDYCNVNITDFSQNKLLLTSPASKSNFSVIITATEYVDHSESERKAVIIVTILASVLLVTFTIVMLMYRVYRNNILLRLRKQSHYDDNLGESTALRNGTYTFDHLKLASIIDQGRYGSVWQASMGDLDVAVKIFPSHYQNYFQNEKDLYCLPFMEHPSLLSYYGSDERLNMDGSTEYLLLVSYAPGGTLLDFLRLQTVDWLTFCKMGLSIVRGLAYLHTDIKRGDKLKPCIAHRDINSRNILLKADGTCCICDLGLAVQISGSKYFSNGEEQHAETKSINDVGTLRYMAPEVLEGAVNLRDCESSLKQIDVYAIGLVLWELVSRCSDIYIPGTEVPPYKLPFEKEFGLHPTFEQMQILVSRYKARPMIEGNIVDNPGVLLIKETMEDCWDSDAEARLTALCIEERIMELQSHRITALFSNASQINSHGGLVSSTTNSLYSDTPHQNGVHVVQLDLHESKGPTDNLVTLSPTASSTHEHSSKNSNEVFANSQAQALQPHQGRNLCQERNLMLQRDSFEDLGCEGNILVNKSSKHQTNDQYKMPIEIPGLVSSDYFAQHVTQHSQFRPVTPIPYVQNDISENSSSSHNKRKQTNVPDTYVQESPRKKKLIGWSSIKKKISNKKKKYLYKTQIDRDDLKSNLLMKNTRPKIIETNVSETKCINGVGKSSVEKTKESETIPLSRRQESLYKFNEIYNVGPNKKVTTPYAPLVLTRDRNGAQSKARFSLYDDRMMCNSFDGDEDRGDRTTSTSVPFGMDLVDDESQSPDLALKDIPCT